MDIQGVIRKCPVGQGSGSPRRTARALALSQSYRFGNTFIEGILESRVAVPVVPAPTFYSRHGDLFAHACLGITAAASALALLRLRRRDSSGIGIMKI